MEIKISVILSADSALLAVLQALASAKPAAAGDSVKISETVVFTEKENGEIKAERKAKAIKTLKAMQEKAPVEDSTETKQTETTMVMGNIITMEDITKAAVPRSRAGHKDKIKAKIAELGYENLADMQSEHFGEFMAFLDTIKL